MREKMCHMKEFFQKKIDEKNFPVKMSRKSFRGNLSSKRVCRLTYEEIIRELGYKNV